MIGKESHWFVRRMNFFLRFQLPALFWLTLQDKLAIRSVAISTTARSESCTAGNDVFSVKYKDKGCSCEPRDYQGDEIAGSRFCRLSAHGSTPSHPSDNSETHRNQPGASSTGEHSVRSRTVRAPLPGERTAIA